MTNSFDFYFMFFNIAIEIFLPSITGFNTISKAMLYSWENPQLKIAARKNVSNNNFFAVNWFFETALMFYMHLTCTVRGFYLTTHIRLSNLSFLYGLLKQQLSRYTFILSTFNLNFLKNNN